MKVIVNKRQSNNYKPMFALGSREYTFKQKKTAMIKLVII